MDIRNERGTFNLLAVVFIAQYEPSKCPKIIVNWVAVNIGDILSNTTTYTHLGNLIEAP